MRPNKIILIFCLVLIQVLSLITIWSTVPDLFPSQLAFTACGLIIIYLVANSDINLGLNFYWFFYLGSIVLLVLTMIFGRSVRGSVRWIDLGLFSPQTSEIIKPMLAIFYSQYLALNPLKKWRDLFLFLFLCSVPVLIVAKQPDLGSALTLFALPLLLLAISGQLKRLVLLAVIFLSLAIPLESKLLRPYQRERLETFINPYSDPKGAGYNVIQATIAVGSGGLLGKGVRLGTQSHLNFLPERHTDFIFASFSEEFGFVGIVVVFTAYFVLLSVLLTAANLLKQKAHKLLALSAFSLILFQTIVNVGMNLGIMPVTGITLPLFSYGGSSLISFSILLGLGLKLLDLVSPFEL